VIIVEVLKIGDSDEREMESGGSELFKRRCASFRDPHIPKGA